MIRIDGPNRPSGIPSKQPAGKKRKSSSPSSTETSGQVQVADATALREKARAMLADMPKVRMERIEEIRDALEHGTYHVESKQVAAHIVANALAERPW